MKTALFFQLLINLILSLVLLSGGVLLLALPLMQKYYEPLIDLLTLYPWMVPIAGITFAVIGLSLFSWTSSLLRRTHYERVSGISKVWIEEKVFEKLLATYWQAKFPEDTLSCHAMMRKNKLHIVAKMPHFADKCAQKELFEEIKNELRSDLHKTLGYTGDFTLSLSYS